MFHDFHIFTHSPDSECSWCTVAIRLSLILCSAWPEVEAIASKSTRASRQSLKISRNHIFQLFLISIVGGIRGNPKYKSDVLFDFQSPCRLQAKPWIRSLDRASVSEMFRTWRALVAVGWRSKQEWNYYQQHPPTNKGGFKVLHSRQPLGFACLQHLLNVWTLDVNAAGRFSWEPSIDTVGLDTFQPRNAPWGLPCRLYFTAPISEVSNVWAEDLRMCQMTKSQRNQHCPTL